MIERDSAAGAATLLGDGFGFVAPVGVLITDYDAQGHLNNASIVRLFNDLRIAYVREAIGLDWVETLGRERLVVAAKEVHVLYESEGFPGESYLGGMRYSRREGKAAVLEQRLVEATTARAIARAWVVQLLVQDGVVVEWPELYFERVGAIDGSVVERRPRGTRSWGPGP